MKGEQELAFAKRLIKWTIISIVVAWLSLSVIMMIFAD